VSVRTLTLRNRQRARPIEMRRVRAILKTLLEESLEIPDYDLGVYLVADAEMTRVNEGYLQHAGTTDVITFDYNEPGRPDWLCGELFVCVDEALRQARRFRVPWETEILRYLVHGVLHLRGYDDLTPAKRRKMKLVENRLVKRLDRG
jgi:probable rRNA maturation factor